MFEYPRDCADSPRPVTQAALRHRTTQADTSFDSQTMIGRQFESDPAGAPRRYENPRDAYDYSIRQIWRTGARRPR
jgi:hypothetical protein